MELQICIRLLQKVYRLLVVTESQQTTYDNK